MKKIFGYLMCMIIALSVFTGCNNKDTKIDKKETKVEEKSKGNCDVFECIKKINVNSSYEEINKIIGFEGTLKSESDQSSASKWKKYLWQLTDTTSIEATIYEGFDSIYLTAYFKNDMIQNKKVDFSNVDKMKEKLNSEEGLKYEEVVEILGGVEGTLEKKDSMNDTYTWVNEKGGSLTARFSTTSKKCTSYNGVF